MRGIRKELDNMDKGPQELGLEEVTSAFAFHV